MNLTKKIWYAKFGAMEEDDFTIALKSTKNISKHHPSNFQKKIIEALNLKITEVNDRYQLNIPYEEV